MANLSSSYYATYSKNKGLSVKMSFGRNTHKIQNNANNSNKMMMIPVASPLGF